ncbi:MAG: hypothetical protein ACKPEN_16565 [Planktothrix sp.]|uniref:hypothetical protein n=1 Tax=Planktothrix sp. TaxID=3088171 RepID=UPI0038D40006
MQTLENTATATNTAILPNTPKDLRIALATGQTLGINRPFLDIQRDLYRKVPDSYYQFKMKGLTQIIYLPWELLSCCMDYITPGWEKSITINQIGERVTVECTVTIHTSDGSFKRTATGSDSLLDEGYGGPVVDAESQAFRRALANFGFCSYLWDKDICNALIKRIKG